MARQRKEKSVKDIPLKQPDRSGPTEKTLLDMAHGKNLFDQADARQRELDRENSGEAVLSPGAERFLEAALWTSTLAMIHFTFEVLVQHQYGMEIDWPSVWGRTARAWLLFLFVFYPLHPHKSNPILVPGIPRKYQHGIRQAIFIAMSLTAGPYLIHISNKYGYLAVMKRAPPLGCLWLWSVVEMELVWGCVTLALVTAWSWQQGYAFA
ncbi:hypothetical protein B0J13DRAFT_44365 [Dactylonectria estremocensis]|uniref:DUF7719 domain-containing protein n=1 Tax=Dactylonectria estremocensis TaxID=1079267 RepID=A0A9P9ET21_9HYPO|nr:hypothetical protein B0J13DRAFT_44365 [Dactylonectria estremocensis]